MEALGPFVFFLVAFLIVGMLASAWALDAAEKTRAERDMLKNRLTAANKEILSQRQLRADTIAYYNKRNRNIPVAKNVMAVDDDDSRMNQQQR